MSFPQLEKELSAVKEEIREINNSIKQLVVQMQLITLTFEGMMKPKQKKEYIPIEVKLPEKINPNSDDARYIEKYQTTLLKEQEKTIEEKRLIKAKEKQEEIETI